MITALFTFRIVRLLLVVGILLMVSVETVSSSLSSFRRPPIFAFDYGKAPVSRWDGALELATRGQSWEDTWGAIFSHHNSSLFQYITPAMYRQMGDALQDHFPEQAEELRGIATQFAQLFPDKPLVSYEYLAAWVYYHELAHSDLGSSSGAVVASDDDSRSCTGLLAADASGSVWHVANMDQQPPAIRDILLQVHFVNSDDNNILFQGVDWYWFTTGTSRMVMSGVVSIQENWRTEEDRQPYAIADILFDIDEGIVPQILVFRNTLEEVVKDPTRGEFNILVNKMSTIRLASPYYVIMAGPQNMQGAIISRNNTGVAAPVLHLGEKDNNHNTIAQTLSSWALVQSNYDHWEADNVDDPRRTVAETVLSNLGQQEGASMLGLYAVASTYPVHNPSTAFTAVMNPRSGNLHSFARVAMCPADKPQCDNEFDNSQSYESLMLMATIMIAVLGLVVVLVTGMSLIYVRRHNTIDPLFRSQYKSVQRQPK